MPTNHHEDDGASLTITAAELLNWYFLLVSYATLSVLITWLFTL